jgi:ElaB/YqjD/DUF883 family membrane-anchored ribosome-binding protein
METQKVEAKEMTTGSNHAGGAFERGVDHAAEGAHQKIDSMRDTGKPAVDRMAASAHGAVDKVSSVASHAIESLGMKGEQLNVAEKRLVAGTRHYVQEHPVASLGIAVATGYFLSRLFTFR